MFRKLFGSSLNDSVDSIKEAIDDVFTSDEERLQAQAVLEKLKNYLLSQQAEINKIDAKSGNFFNSGWRPFAGWICGLGLATQYVINPYVEWIVGRPGPLIDIKGLLELIMGLLGLAYIRSSDKAKGVAK